MSEGSDLRVRQASEQGQQGGEEKFVVNDAISTRTDQNVCKFTKPSFETFHLEAWSGQRIVHRILENDRKQKKIRNRGTYTVLRTVV